MKKMRAIIFGIILGIFSLSSTAQIYIDPLNIEAGEGFDVTEVVIFGSSPSVITNAYSTVSGTNITIELSATIGHNLSLDIDKTTVSIPPLPDGSYTSTTFINGSGGGTRYKKQFSIPYEGFWTPNEIDHWNRLYPGDPVAPDTFFSNLLISTPMR